MIVCRFAVSPKGHKHFPSPMDPGSCKPFTLLPTTSTPLKLRFQPPGDKRPCLWWPAATQNAAASESKAKTPPGMNFASIPDLLTLACSG